MTSYDDEWDSNNDQHLDTGKDSRLGGALSFRTKDVGGYCLGRILGKGSCAVVRLGTHKDTGKEAAIKILKPRTLREQKEALREIEALQRLNHPNITRLEKVIRENGYTCLILELGTGGELFDYVMNSGKLDEEEARFMFRQILSGLQYCHANLVAHRDLKPENLLLDEYGNVKISDFGLSNVLKPGSLFSTWCGSPVYTPPEVVLRRQYNGISMDIWSLGVVLYVLVTGGMPWRLESNVVKNIDDLIAGNYEIPDFLNVSDDCRDLIGMMLIADSSKRANMETIMNHKWTCEGFEGPPETHLAPKPLVTKINEDIFLQLASLGYDLAKARKAIKTDPTSPALTAYFLLHEKHQRAQRLNNIKASEAVSKVSTPGDFLQNVGRARSNSHPITPPRSPLNPRRELTQSARFSPDQSTPSKKGGLIRNFLDRFKKSPSPASSPSSRSPRSRNGKKDAPSITAIVMAHNSPSPPARRRF